MVSVSPKKELCVVCEAEIEGVHFGQPSCKACAAFFRRAVATKSVFNCKFESRCEISKDMRNLCRYCRYQKCLNKGMQPCAVQANYDNRRSASRHLGSPNSQAASLAQSYQEMKRLPQMLEGYIKFQSLKKAAYNLLRSKTDIDPCDPESIPPSNYSNVKKSYQMKTNLIFDIIMEHFVPFSSLPARDQKILFDTFLVIFSNAEKIYNTYQAYGHIKDNDKVILADGGYVKYDNAYKYYMNSVDVNTDPERCAKMFLQCYSYIAKVAVPTMSKTRIDDLSMVALYGLCLFQDYNADISPETRELAVQIKDQIIYDLHVYYRNLGYGETELTTTISQILLLIPVLEQTGRLFRENFYIADLFCMLQVPNAYVNK